MSSLIERIGVRLPIVQAPMAGTSTPEMAAAVTNAGALGSIAVGAADAEVARRTIAKVREATTGPFNVNLFCHAPARVDVAREAAWIEALRPEFERYEVTPPLVLREIYRSFVEDDAMLQVLLETRPKVVSFHFGLPSTEKIAALKSASILLLSAATSLDEGVRAREAGIDAIVAQGYEAGGHRGVFDPAARDDRLGVLALTQLLVQKLSMPVISAGGIMDGAGIAAALALGAEAAQLGTAFIGCPESSADAYHRAALFGEGAAHTTMTADISGREARCLPNRFTALEARLTGVARPDYPIAYDAAKALQAAAKAKSEGGYGAQWAGQGAPLARSLPCAELVAVLEKELVAGRSRG